MRTSYTKHSKAFKLAHSIKDAFQTWGEALRTAWAMIRALYGSEETVTFEKKDGTVTTRRITAITTDNYTFKGKPATPKPNLYKFVDLDKLADWDGKSYPRYIISFYASQLRAA